MIEAIPLERHGAEFVFGVAVGGVIGYAAGKAARLLAIVIGVQLALFRFLEAREIVVVDYGRLTAGLVQSTPTAGDPGWIVSVLSGLSVAGGFVVGFVVGFREA